MIPLKDILVSALKSVNLETVGEFAQIESGWNEIVGESLSKVARPGSLNDRILTVDVFDPAFMEPMEYSRLRILQRISEKGGSRIVKDIRLRYKDRKDDK